MPAGEHTLIYTFDPQSFFLGGVLSMAELVAMAGLAWSPGRFAPALPPVGD